MNEINRQVHLAQRRIFVGNFFRILGWSLFAGLLVAALGLAIPKIWAFETLETEAAVRNWNLGWILGGSFLSLLVASMLTWISRGSSIEAALEVDKRFGLKERISSALSLDSKSAQTAAGSALIDDANRRVQKVDIRDAFPFKPTWKALLPLIPALVLIALIFLPNAVKEVQATVPPTLSEKKKEVRIAIEQSQKKLSENIKKLEEKGLKDAKLDFKSLGKKVDELNSGSEQLKKDALVKLNEIKKQVEEQKKQFGDAEEMKREFNQLKRIEQGPARKLNSAMAQGDFEEAKKVIKDLAKKLADGKLSSVEKKQLAQNMQDMAEQVKNMAEKHEQKKQELKDRIEQAMKEGNLDQAAKLQQQLEDRQNKDRQMDKMRKIADQLQKAGDAMKNKQQQGNQQQGKKPQQGNQKQQQGNQQQGNGNSKQEKQNSQGQSGDQQGNQQEQSQPGQGNQPSEAQTQAAQQALEDLAEEMENIQADLESLEALEDLEQDLQDCKNDLNGCEGQGGAGGKGDKPNWNDWGKGEGKGGGKRARDESGDTGHFKSQVRGKIQKGETVVTGNADGENIAGQSIAEARADIQSSISGDTDPLEDQTLPRAQREHAQQYFERLRGN